MKQIISKKRAFTLIELLVSIFIFTIILASSVLAGNFNMGRIRANQDRAVAESAKAVFDAINQKMKSANAHVRVNNTEVYGFNVDSSGKILIIASKDELDRLNCTFFAQNDDAIWMTQNLCIPTSLTGINQPLTHVKVNVKDLIFTPSAMMINNSPSTIPELKVSMDLEHKDDPTSKTSLQTSYILSYENVKSLKN